MGDPAGIGPEIVVKAFLDEDLSRGCRGIVVGDADWLQRTAKKFAPELSVHPVTSVGQARFQPGTLDVLHHHNVPENLAPRQASPAAGKACVEYIRHAVELAMANQVDAITTAPINKESLHLAGYRYPGHTELLAHLTGAPQVALMLAGRKLRVVLVTTHVPLQSVTELITADRVAKIILLTHRWLLENVSSSPRIAVTGLNPHCGDGGIFGDEEKESIVPAIERVSREGIRASGPFSADSLFARTASGEYDAVVAMYHDQGMIPVKMESTGTAVNITLGLPIIRTSVDHGTAYDIAGDGIASPESLKIAIQAAAALCNSPVALQ